MCLCGGGGGGRGEEGKAPIKKFMLLVLHLPIACADAEGEYLRQTAYLSTHIIEQFAHLFTISYYYPLLL